MELNRNDKRRQEILGIKLLSDEYDVHRTEFTFEELKQLKEENFLDLESRQNYAPSTGDFMEWLENNPKFMAHGYIVTPDRDDYRVSIEGVESSEELTKSEARRFVDFCRMADEFDFEDFNYRAWWD